MKNQPELVGKIILANFLEYSVKKFIAFVSDIENSPLYKRLVHDGVIVPKSFAEALRHNNHDILKDGSIVRVEGTDNFHLRYTAREFSTEYHINHGKLGHYLNSTNLDVERKNTTLLLNKARRINTRNQIVHRILETIIEQQKDYFTSEPLA